MVFESASLFLRVKDVRLDGSQVDVPKYARVALLPEPPAEQAEFVLVERDRFCAFPPDPQVGTVVLDHLREF
jgi:hypothetical protein